MRVDIRKLDQVRELIDECVAEKCIFSPHGRIYALETVIWDLGFNVEVKELDHWFFASAISHDDQQRTNRIYLRKGLAAAVIYESYQFARQSVVAYTREDALLALACQVIDPNADIFLPEQQACESVFWSRCKEHPSEIRFWREISGLQWQEFDEVCGPSELRAMQKS